MPVQRKYTEEEKAVALAAYDACEHDVSRTAKFTGIPRKTLEYWVKGTVSEPVAKLCHVKKGELADRLEHLAGLVLDGIHEKLPEASFVQCMTGFGIAVDKMRLLREQSTNIVDEPSLSDTDRADRIMAIIDRARARRDAAALAPTSAPVLP